MSDPPAPLASTRTLTRYTLEELQSLFKNYPREMNGQTMCLWNDAEPLLTELVSLERKNETLRNAWQTSEKDRATALTALAQQDEEIARLKGEATGTYACPICGKAQVHGHSDDEVFAWLDAQASSYGYRLKDKRWFVLPENGDLGLFRNDAWWLSKRMGDDDAQMWATTPIGRGIVNILNKAQPIADELALLRQEKVALTARAEAAEAEPEDQEAALGHDARVQAVHLRLTQRANEIKSAHVALEEAAEEIVDLAESLAALRESPPPAATELLKRLDELPRAGFADRDGHARVTLFIADVRALLESAAGVPPPAPTLLAKRAQQTAADLRLNPDHEDVEATCRLIEDLAAAILYLPPPAPETGNRICDVCGAYASDYTTEDLQPWTSDRCPAPGFCDGQMQFVPTSAAETPPSTENGPR